MPAATADHRADNKLPRGLLVGAGALVIASLLLVSIARLSGYQPAQPPSAPSSRVTICASWIAATAPF